MTVINYFFNIIINVRIEMLTTLPMINATRHNMKKMRDHTRTNKDLALGIIINAPRVTESMSYSFKSVFSWMVFPNTPININAICF